MCWEGFGGPAGGHTDSKNNIIVHDWKLARPPRPPGVVFIAVTLDANITQPHRKETRFIGCERDVIGRPVQ